MRCIMRTFSTIALIFLGWITCLAAQAQVVAQCGPTNGAYVDNTPTTGLCSVGTNSEIYGTGPWSWTCAANTIAHCSAQLTGSSSGPDKPGPSTALFADPYYTCLRNFYVATTGSDANPGTWSRPFRSIAQAQAVGLQAGDCVNVEPGTYAAGVWVSSGGNNASSTGYVVYRCTTMDACMVTDVTAGGTGAFVWNNTRYPMAGSYVIIDGFVLSAAWETSGAKGIAIATNGFVPSVHHVWILNSIVSGYGQTGVQLNQGEYFYVIHNTIYNNARVSCASQGSGISFAALMAAPGYTPTADDLSNSVLGNIGSSFHNAVEWNIVYNNAVTNCGNSLFPTDTDGNNIIMDTLNWDWASGTVPYTGGVLIAFNVTYDAGGGGIHLFNSDKVTVANNTCYNNNLDPYLAYTARACIDSMQSYYGNTIINNVAVAVPASHSVCLNSFPYAMWNSAFLAANDGQPDVFSNNISQVVGSGCYGEAPMWGSDTYSCSTNKCATNPGWVSVGGSWTGSETSPPDGANFALQPGSPAIGYGLTESYLPPSSVDVGACSSVFNTCP
jgi:parallel beta-helix repeat protein